MGTFFTVFACLNFSKNYLSFISIPSISLAQNELRLKQKAALENP